MKWLNPEMFWWSNDQKWEWLFNFVSKAWKRRQDGLFITLISPVLNIVVNIFINVVQRRSEDLNVKTVAVFLDFFIIWKCLIIHSFIQTIIITWSDIPDIKFKSLQHLKVPWICGSVDQWSCTKQDAAVGLEAMMQENNQIWAENKPKDRRCLWGQLVFSADNYWL